MVHDGQTQFIHKGDAGVLGSFYMLTEVISSRNVEFLVSHNP